ncbi:4-hydroxy-tetrahydrodipicolinate synthase [Pseudomonas syringae]|nr:4-hydroxy-tetrahydrodipicolinate synthase [Pseudomonas syringae]MBD8573176.1 4-hydroxy-tetrahydrodipicolinate synthase [Pseudomonas syringae]MBD8790312.1 4-hydroxy-tetrahydrodipicolinate synthase [Pseudomonas syringae]MBD8799190.1 4-hydroxy-tetrahydrodipicolinate synthase [Pseudomonas syringae]MBD8810016.1 4-hydroxy-tetrahydrodipicolinate synthase [Pseudomonas syringae]
MSAFRGIWVALATPFCAGEVDFNALDALVGKLLEEGVRGLVVCGTTGEAAALSHAEQLAVLDAVLARVPSRQVIMGLAGNNLRELLAFQQQIQQRPLAGLLVPAPYYIRPSQQGIEAFFQTVADAATVPVVLYDIPYRTGVRIERETLRRILHHPRIAAVKDCGGDLDTTTALIADGHAEILTGEDLQIFNNLCLGGAGAISASAHVRADLYVQMQRQIDSGQLTAARQTFYRLLPWMRVAFAEPNPAVIKAALALQGFGRDELREPMQRCSAQTQERLRAVLAGLQVPVVG